MTTRDYLLDYLDLKVRNGPFATIADARSFLEWSKTCEALSPWDRNKVVWAKNIVALNDHIAANFPG